MEPYNMEVGINGPVQHDWLMVIKLLHRAGKNVAIRLPPDCTICL